MHLGSEPTSASYRHGGRTSAVDGLRAVARPRLAEIVKEARLVCRRPGLLRWSGCFIHAAAQKQLPASGTSAACLPAGLWDLSMVWWAHTSPSLPYIQGAVYSGCGCSPEEYQGCSVRQRRTPRLVLCLFAVGRTLQVPRPAGRARVSDPASRYHARVNRDGASGIDCISSKWRSVK